MTISADTELGWSGQPPSRGSTSSARSPRARSSSVRRRRPPFLEPALFLLLLLTVCVTSAWKVNFPISLTSGSTLSVSYAADLMALLLLGPRAAVAIAAVGAWTQCTVNVSRRYPLYRSAFSVAAEILTMAATGAVYRALGGGHGAFDVASLMKPLFGAIATYFLCNTSLVAVAIGLSTGGRRSPCGTMTSSGVQPASSWRDPRERWRPSSSIAASIGRPC